MIQLACIYYREHPSSGSFYLGHRILHILPEIFRFRARRTSGTPALRCSHFKQTALEYGGPPQLYKTFPLAFSSAI